MKYKYIRFKVVIEILIMLLVLIIANVKGIDYLGDFPYAGVILNVGIPIFGIGFILIKSMYLKSFSYYMDKDNIHVNCGFITKTYTCYPIRRIQQITFDQQIIQRKYKVATVHIITGGQVGKIKAMKEEEAKALSESAIATLNVMLDEE